MTVIEYILVGIFLLFLEMTYMRAAVKFRILDKPHHQSSHTGVVVRGGGYHFLYSICLVVGFTWF